MKLSFLRLFDCLLIIALFFQGTMGYSAFPQEEFLYIPLFYGNTVAVLNTKTHSTVSVSTGTPSSSLVISPDGKFVYTCNPRTNTVTVIRTSDNSIISTIAVGARPMSLALTPDGKFLYVANENDDNVSVIDALKNVEITDSATRISVGNAPYTIAVRPQGDIVYVANRLSGTVSVIWTWNNSVISTITLSNSSWLADIVFSPDGQFAYAVDHASGDLFVIDINRGNASTSSNIGGAPWSITFSPDGQFIFVGKDNDSSIQALLLSASQENVILTSKAVDGLVTSPDGHFLYAASRGNPGVVSTIHLLSQTEVVAARIDNVGNDPSRRIAITPSIPLVNVTPHRTDSLVSTDFYNVITWSEPANPFPLHYKVYRDRALTQLLKSVPCSTGTDCQKICEEHSLLPSHTYNYYVVAENDYGIVSIGTASLTVHA